MKNKKISYRAASPILVTFQDSNNRFTDEDHRIIRQALLQIPEQEKRIVFLRFWKNLNKKEIASYVGVSREKVEAIIASAFKKLEALCLTHSRFSYALEQAQRVCVA